MIDEKAVADRGARMDIDSCNRMRVLGHDAREQRNSLRIQLVSQPENRNGEDRRIREDHFIDAFRGGIPVIGGLHVGRQPDTQIRDLA